MNETSKYTNFKVFLISFAVGLLYIYLTDDYKKVIIVYPTPMNTEKKLYDSKQLLQVQLKEATCLQIKKIM